MDFLNKLVELFFRRYYVEWFHHKHQLFHKFFVDYLHAQRSQLFST